MSSVKPAQFGPFVLDAAARTLHRHDVLVALPPKAMDLLIVLVESAGTVVSKDDLMRRVWPDTFVEEGNLPVTVFALRKALGDEGDGFIRTVPRRGYCFTAAVGPVGDPTRVEPSVAELPTVQPVDATLSPAWSARRRWAMRGAAIVSLAAVALLALTWTRRAAAPTGPVRTVAVLPFSLIDVGTADEYLGSGLAADVTQQLADGSRMVVRPFASSAKYGNDAREATRALQVDAVLTGSIRPVGNAWRITAELRRMSDGSVLWTTPAAEQEAPLWTAARAISRGVVATLDDGTPGVTAPGSDDTSSAEAYRSYLQGLSAGSQMTVPGVAAAVEHLQRAVTTDPTFGAAHAALATYALLPPSAASTPALVARAKDAAARALALRSDSASAHAARGLALVLGERQWDDAGAELQRAVTLRPNDSETRLWRGLYLGARGRHDEALNEVGLALALDPTGPRAHYYRGFLLLMARRYDEALAQFRQTPLELGVVTQQVAFGMAVANTMKGRGDLAREALGRIRSLGVGPQVRVYRAFVQAQMGDRDAATVTLREAITELDGRARSPRTMMAAAQACLGQMDAAFENLRMAPDEGDPRILFAAVDPALDCARSDPRFAVLLKDLGLAP